MTQGRGRIARAKTFGNIEAIGGLIVGLAIALILIEPREGESTLQTVLFIQIPTVLMIAAGFWGIRFGPEYPTPTEQYDSYARYRANVLKGGMVGAGLGMITGTLITVFIFRPYASLDARMTGAVIICIGIICGSFVALIGGFLGAAYGNRLKKWYLKTKSC